MVTATMLMFFLKTVGETQLTHSYNYSHTQSLKICKIINKWQWNDILLNSFEFS